MNPHRLQNGCFPIFSVLRPNRSTTEASIVFNASAEFQGQRLNSDALPGTKLPTDMFSIIVRFPKELIAFLDDLSQTMIPSICFNPEDRPPQYSLEGFRSEPEV